MSVCKNAGKFGIRQMRVALESIYNTKRTKYFFCSMRIHKVDSKIKTTKNPFITHTLGMWLPWSVFFNFLGITSNDSSIAHYMTRET